MKVVASVGEVREESKLPFPPKLAKWDEEVWDEGTLRQAEPNEPLELFSVSN